ncbi:MAG: beta-ketoacyl-ACP synthase II [candidate division Zixibacteria bacterium]|nr:beta-ketoacyl-ACP synthase II [candidate division Zixibacteria bacterium]
MKTKVVITGMGALTPVGNTLADTWANLLAGKSGVRTITRFSTEGMSTTIAAELDGLEPEKYIDKKTLRRMDRNQMYSMIAAQMAYDDAGLDQATLDLDRCGIVIGSGIGGIETLEEQHRILLERGPGRISPFFVPMMIVDMSAGLAAIRFNFRGPNYATVSACASSAHAIADAFRIIQRGEADLVMAGGTESAITPLSMAGFCAAKALSTRNDEPEKASRPFDRDRDGFIMGEGSGILILESLESARARGARIYAEIIGAGMTCDAYHMTAPLPDGQGAAKAMQLSLKDAGLQPADVDYINAHGTSTPLGDIAETKAIKAIFGGHAYKLAVNSTKSMTGHLLGAAGALEAIVVAKSIQEGRLHPTINLVTPDPECDLDYVPNVARARALKCGISNSFGFGGHNVTLVLTAADTV